MPSCEPADFSLAELRAAVALELATSGLALATAAEPDAEPEARVALDTSCEHGAPIELRAVWHEQSGARTLRIDELPKAARPRAIALAVAELLAGLRSPADVTPENVELAEGPASSADDGRAATAAATASTPPPVPTANATKPREPAPAANRAPGPGTADDHGGEMRKPTRPREHALALSAEFRSFEFRTNTAGVRLRYDLRNWGFGVATLFGHETGTLGVASALIVHGYLERRLTLLGRADGTWLTLGPRAGIGAVEVHSTANPGALDTTVAEPYLDLAGFLDFSANAAPLRFGLRVELGYALGLVALEDSHQLASYAGPFGSALLDVGLAL